MILTIDIGNTKIKYGLFKKNKLMFSDSLITSQDFLDNLNTLKKYPHLCQQNRTRLL